MSNPNEFISSEQPSPDNRTSISTYFPEGTQYFYGYPAGEDSNFLNNVPPKVDELVAARTLSCAGPDVSVVSFASTTAHEIDPNLMNALAIPQIDPDRMTILPSHIDMNLHGEERNKAIISALAHAVPEGSLVMAQPYTNEEMEHLYQIPSEVITWVNDKANMTEFVDDEFLPTRYSEYESGSEFAADISFATRADVLPCVVKVSSSSAGDGVHMCFTQQDIAAAQKTVESIQGRIYVEQYVTEIENYAIHFAISHDQEQPIDIIGYNDQLTSPDGEFLGGIITGEDIPPKLRGVKQHLESDILPKIRSKGWYGVGGFDVIVDDKGNPYLIDGNFRMTGMSAYHFMVNNGDIKAPMISFGAQFVGSQQEFEEAVLPMAGVDSPEKTKQIIALSRHGQEWDFNGALMYEDEQDRSEKIQRILDIGIVSVALRSLASDV